MDGEIVGPYRILESLGKGGMGEVYRAEDTRLDRQVALKILPPELAADPERRARFEREAKVVAALNHPNIVVLYTVEQAEPADGETADPQRDPGPGPLHFLTMELVEGKTLSEIIPRDGLSLEPFFDVAIPLADALAAAHERGIVHRDLKPSNVMLTREGRVKVLDFGLARLRPETGTEGETGTEAPTARTSEPGELTGEGEVLGTTAYMSPEQAEGKPLDHRTDIFSLGVLLYEMATGQRPFRGETRVSIVSSIVKDTPDAVTDLNPRLPRHLGRIIRLALEKDPERRIQTAKDLRNQLSELRREVESGELGSAAPSPAGASLAGRRWAWGALALVAIVTVVGLLYFARPEGPSPVPPARPLTAFTGHESEPALSPDGTRVAFTWDGGDERGAAQLYAQLIDRGDPLPLTEGSAGALSPTWSPDGTRIAFLRRREEDEGLLDVLVVPALGGDPRRVGTVVSPAGHGLSWSPEGTELAVVHRESPEDPDAIFLLSTDGTEQRRRLTSPPPGIRGDTMPVFSPDGRSVAFSRVRLAGWGYADVHVQGVDEDEPDRITFGDERVHGLDWIPDGSGLVVSSGPGGSPDRGLYRVVGSAREPLRLGENLGRVTTARTAPRLVYARLLEELNIWRAGGPASDQRAAPIRLISSTRRDADPQYSPDGSRIAIVSDRTGTHGIWTCDAATGGNCTLVTTSLGPTGQPRWSPDGGRIAYYGETEEGNPDVHVIRVDGSSRRRLTDDPSRDGTPWWSRDGEWIYFTSARSGSPQIWKVPATGGQPRQITENGGVMPFESADGKYVYYSKALGQSAIWRVPVGGGEETLVLDEKVNFQSWSVWRDKLVFLRAGTIFSRDLDTGETEELATPGSDVTGFVGLAISPDGRRVLYSQRRTGSDLMIMDDIR